MPVKIVLHAKTLDPFFLAVKDAVEHRGGTIVQSDVFDADNLHLTYDVSQIAANVVAVRRPRVTSACLLDHVSLKQAFNADAVSYAAAKDYFERLRAMFANGKRALAKDLPDEMLAICLTSKDVLEENRVRTLRMIADGSATGRTVILASDEGESVEGMAKLAAPFDNVRVWDGRLVDVLHKVSAVVSRRGAGADIAHIHRTPTVLYEPSNVDPISPVACEERPFNVALQEALALDGIYAKYLYWRYQMHALDAKASEFADRLFAAFAKVGFDTARLGLDLKTGLSSTIASTHDAVQFLTAFLAEQPDVAAITLKRVLKISDKSWVFLAKLNGQQVVVKRFLEGDPVHTVKSSRDELAFVSRALGNGPYRVNDYLFGWPNAGIVILSFASGQRLFDVIAASNCAERARYLKEGGAWLNAYAAPRNRQSTLGARYWLDHLNARLRDQLSIDDNELFERACSSLRQLAKVVAGCPVTQAASHGDYAGINVMYDNGIVTGVDIQGTCWIALARDAARFIAWQAQYDRRETGQRTYGIDDADYAAFFAGLPLLASEHRSTIPFFIGVQIMERFLDGADQGKDVAQERLLLQEYLADIDALIEELKL